MSESSQWLDPDERWHLGNFHALEEALWKALAEGKQEVQLTLPTGRVSVSIYE